MKMMRIFVDGRVQEKIFIRLAVLVKIAVVENYFAAIWFVKAVYFFTLFSRENEGEFQRRVFNRQKFCFDLILIHGGSLAEFADFFQSQH